MASLREDQFANFLSRQASAANGLLIYGEDQSAAEDYARQAAAKIAGDDPLGVTRLQASVFTSDPARLTDEFLSISLLGGRRALIVSDCDDSILKLAGAVIGADRPGNFIILVAGILPKSSKLRAACEQARNFFILPLYEAKAEAVLQAITHMLAGHGLKFAAGAGTRFLELVGDDRMLAAREAEKLSLYAHGQAEISITDVEAACGDSASFDGDQLIDALFGGDLESCDRIARAVEQDSAARPVLPLILSHIGRLQALQLDVARGMTADGAVAAAKPMIFFNRRKAIADQLRSLPPDKLELIQSIIADAILASRKMAALAPAITNRGLLAAARLARAAKTGR